MAATGAFRRYYFCHLYETFPPLVLLVLFSLSIFVVVVVVVAAVVAVVVPNLLAFLLFVHLSSLSTSDRSSVLL